MLVVRNIYISPTSHKLVSPHFHSGVMKIQEGRGHEMNNLEDSCSKLQIENVPEQQQALADERGVDFAQRCVIRKRRKLETTSNYLNFVGSCAEIERVWSHAELILRKSRQCGTAVHHLKWCRELGRGRFRVNR